MIALLMSKIDAMASQAKVMMSMLALPLLPSLTKVKALRK
ncbi:hypothetical protein LINPERPRIM_LOCUS41606 [Linum perenne]